MNDDPKQFAEATLRFLMRAQISGSEALALVQCVEVLTAIAEGRLVLVDPAAHKPSSPPEDDL